MARPALDLAGEDYGYLHVLDRAENSRGGRVQWRCRCTYKGCGNIAVVQTRLLRNGETSSCGCLAAEHGRQTIAAARAALAARREYPRTLYADILKA